MADIDIDLSGPLFDGRGPAIVAAMVQAAEYDIAATVYSEVMTNLNRSIRNPTPYYETQITNERLTAGRRVHDRGIVYGPWLEHGRSSTRFRGYASFQRALQAVRPRATAIAWAAIRRYIGQL